MSQPDIVEAIRQGDEDVKKENYEIAFLPRARKDFDEWKRYDGKTVERIKEILRDIAENPYSGIGKPEPFKHNLTGIWSRRINKTDRIVYSVDGNKILVYLFSGHYQKKLEA